MAASAPQLAPPGAGIPVTHRWYVRIVVIPKVLRKRDWEGRQRAFRREGEKVVELLRGESAERLTQQALIAPMVGLEDSSRNWSVLMTAEHMVTVGDQTSELIVGLAQGRTAFPPADPAKVKPVGSYTALDGPTRFQAFLDRFDERLVSVKNRGSRFRFRHPWFGKLTAVQWHAVALLHQGLHRRQCEAILAALPASNISSSGPRGNSGPQAGASSSGTRAGSSSGLPGSSSGLRAGA